MAITETDPTVVDADEMSDERSDDAVDVSVSDELLVEEISIDGMCGVY